MTLALPGSPGVEFLVTVESPRLWSPEEPNLYQARVKLGGDEQIDRFGIRDVEISGYRIMLNGMRLKIKGANGRRTIEERFTWDSVAADMRRKYEEIIERA